MTFPTYETLSALLLTGLLCAAIGHSLGRRRGYREATHRAAEEVRRVARNTTLWHQQAQTLGQGEPAQELPTERERTRWGTRR